MHSYTQYIWYIYGTGIYVHSYTRNILWYMYGTGIICAFIHTVYCKSRIFRMHFIFVYFVRGGFRTKIKCILKFQSKSENPQRSVAVRKFHAYERSGVPRIRKFSAYEIFWIYSIWYIYGTGIYVHSYCFCSSTMLHFAEQSNAEGFQHVVERTR